MHMEDIKQYSGDKQIELQAFYTPDVLVEKMYEQVTDVVGKTILDPAAGTGNILMHGLELKLKAGMDFLSALKEIYAIELDTPTYKRLTQRFMQKGLQCQANEQEIQKVLDKNFVNADALTYDYNFGEKPTRTFGAMSF